MTCRKEMRGGKPHWVIDIPYRITGGARRRFRRDARVQTKAAAEAEERRHLVELATTGEIRTTAHEPPPEPASDPGTLYMWDDAVRRLRLCVLPTKKPSTRHGYNEMFDGPHFAWWRGQPLASITAAPVTAWDAEIANSGVGDSRRRNLHVGLRSALRAAVVAGYLAAMPELPKLPKVGKTEVNAASAADIALILNEPFGKGCGPHRKKSRRAARLAFALSAYAGLRASEVRGLRWSDVNLKAKTITIRRAICFGEIDTPKSGNERTVPIAAPLFAMLVEAAKKPRSPWGPVAPKADGEVWADHGLLQALKRACKRLGISGQRYHGLRHYFVSALFEGGASAPTVQELAGHASLDVTQRYAHTTREAKQRAVAVFALGNGEETTLATPVAGGEKAS